MEKVDREKTVVLIGADRLQVGLISFFLEKKFNLKTTALPSNVITPDLVQRCEFVLSDYEKTDLNHPYKIIDPSGNGYSFQVDIALFNVVWNTGVMDEIYQKDIRGVFFTGDTLETFECGLGAMLRGESWFPEMAGRRIKQGRDEAFFGNPPLTRREKEVLNYMSNGSSNCEIAEYLNISPHTVKNHITNIYKKINVANRLQACMWAARYLA